MRSHGGWCFITIFSAVKVGCCAPSDPNGITKGNHNAYLKIAFACFIPILPQPTFEAEGSRHSLATGVAISIDQRLQRRVDALVRQKAFVSRNSATQQAVEEKLVRRDRQGLPENASRLI
jgi:hypothetical protein